MLAEEEAPIADELSTKRHTLQQSEQQETAKVQAIDTFLRNLFYIARKEKGSDGLDAPAHP